jgi:nucleoside-diphosphate-sugar epimerase
MKLTSRVVVTGGTGNTGFQVVSLLRYRHPQLEILALVRPGRDVTALTGLGVKSIDCDFSDPKSLTYYLKPDDVFLEMANLRFSRSFLPILEKIGIKRAFCLTTTAVFSKFHTYSLLYRKIEDEILKSSIDITILRPSMIYGNENDHNMHKLLKFMAYCPFFPIFGDGEALMQPVHVYDLAASIVYALEKDARGVFNIAGPSPITYKNVLDECANALHRRIIFFHIPHNHIANAVKFLERIRGFPFKHEQIMRLLEDKNFDIDSSVQVLGHSPREFRVGIALEVIRLRKIGYIK